MFMRAVAAHSSPQRGGRIEADGHHSHQRRHRSYRQRRPHHHRYPDRLHRRHPRHPHPCRGQHLTMVVAIMASIIIFSH